MQDKNIEKKWNNLFIFENYRVYYFINQKEENKLKKKIKNGWTLRNRIFFN